MPNDRFLYHPYPSQRMTAFAQKGMVTTSQPLAAQAGIEIMKKGGNAIDAAIATAAVLTVVEPTSNGIGSDAFALVWTKGELFGLNSSGRSPKNISIEGVKERGHNKMPTYGWIPVTVPGAPGAWAELSRRFGKLPLTEVLKPAIEYAEQGYPVSPTVGKLWKRAFENYKKVLIGEEFANWFQTFAPGGKPPEIGEVWRSPDHAKTLRAISETNAEAFYHGDLADKIAASSKQFNGFLTKDDLANFKPEWVQPIKVNYRGYDVWEIPPNGQGIVALLALNLLKGYDFSMGDDINRCHKQIEAMKLAFADGKKYVTEPSKMTVKVDELLSEQYAAERRQLIGKTARTPEPGTPPNGGTVYLAAADNEGNMVSFIQSNYMGFGSGIVVPETGISLQNRGHDFSLNPDHDNRLEGGKRTYHTIIPGFLTKENEAVGPFGVMGGYMQPQGHVQVMMNTIDFHLNPQAALDAPRWKWVSGKKVEVEPGFPNQIAQALERRGHEIEVALDSTGFGRGQIIWRDPKTGVLQGGTEPRADGVVAIW
ncbi:gamma-glutamyltransferase family protein [Neobacillus muris]|uniref:gamma-glutamyltransferase family protein n=1 Tax=Neobacillus muris TaxID=2941334 RepID=UPI00204227F5|nr:gamma-glutamyltransferase family protein [Neobacillus muris]